MKSGWNIVRLQKGPLLRVFAVVLLLHAGADLAFPELCPDKPFDAGFTQSLDLASRASGNETSPPLAAPAPHESKDERRSDPQPGDEDCFCCCTHVMPSPLFVAPGDAEPGLLASRYQNTSIPAPPPNNPYHPPRFA